MTILIARVVIGVAIGAGIGWWGLGLYRGFLFQVWSEESAPYILGFAGCQLVSWAVMIGVLRRSLRVRSPVFNGLTIVGAFGLLFSNLLFYFTPALGAPFGLLVGIAASPLLFAPRVPSGGVHDH